MVFPSGVPNGELDCIDMLVLAFVQLKGLEKGDCPRTNKKPSHKASVPRVQKRQ